MKILAIAFSLALLAGCNTGNSANRDDSHETPGQVAGRQAYELEKDAKKGAKELSKDLKSFSRDAHEGYQEQKQKDQEKKADDSK